VKSEAIMAIRFPGEDASYRDARDKLLEAEIQLRKQLESVAALRRELPVGGRIPQDYVFDEDKGQVRLSQLFKPDQPSLIIYNFMFGPAMSQACTSCTSILDGLNGTAPHVMDRVAFVVVAKSPMPRIREFAHERGWTNLRLLSSASNSYNRDYHGELEDGSQMPMLNVFTKQDGAIHHFCGTELLQAPKEQGQDGRHVDLIWPLWNLFDLTPEGRGKQWYPKLKYHNLVSIS
jgi:predicted dithiol-disulfide oxidoreductase (DUF899 family)